MIGEEKQIKHLQGDNILLESNSWDALQTLKHFYGGFLAWVRAARYWNLDFCNLGLLVEWCQESGEINRLWYYSGCVPWLDKWAVCVYEYDNGPRLLGKEGIIYGQ